VSKWHDLLAEYADDLKWNDPATEEAIASAETALKVQFPPSLRSFLLESNGLYDPDGYFWHIWPVENIITQNLEIRGDPKRAELYMSFESLLFFTTPGVDGIRFAFPISATGKVGEKIYSWEPIEDSRPCIAWSLESYLTRWLSDDLKI
jgi:hypothetical protein